MPAFIVRACAPCVSRLVSSCQLRFLYDIALDIVMLDETPLRPVTRERGGRGRFAVGRGASYFRLTVDHAVDTRVDTAITVRMTVPLCSTDGLVYPDRGQPGPAGAVFETGVR